MIAEVAPNVAAPPPLPLPNFAVAAAPATQVEVFSAPARAAYAAAPQVEVFSAPGRAARAAFAAVPPLGTTVVTTGPQFTREVISTPAREAFAAVPTVSPPPAVSNFMISNPLQPVPVHSEIVVGAVMPRTVMLQPVPNYRYQYVYANGQPVLVDPATRQIVFVLR